MKETLAELLLKSLCRFDAYADVYLTKEDKVYTSVKRIELLNQVITLYYYFESLHLQKDDKVAIISENRVEWVVTDLACIFKGLISVPLYTSLSSESVRYIIDDSDAVVCFVSNALQLDKILSVKDNLPKLKHLISYNGVAPKHSELNITTFSEIMRNKYEYERNNLCKKLEKFSSHISEEDVFTIIYTSGTTGTPKGVMLTQKNLYSNLIACTQVLPITDKDIFLSYLPYSHIFERTAGYYLALITGGKVYYAQSIDTIGQQMQEAKPTVVITVPRLLDKMYNRLMKSTEEMENGYKKRLFIWALNVARFNGKNKSSLKWKIADKLVFSKIREKTGGNLRFFASGGGALNKSIGEFFDGIGIATLEGYGMTETSPVITVNRPEDNIYGTIGVPLNGVEVKIAEDGEILAKGDNVMKGYYKDEASTKETIIDGWMHTGDLGEWVKSGHLRITDRKKSLFKSSGGKYVAPAQIEELINQLPYIDQSIIIGNNKMYVTALIVPEMSELKALAYKLKLHFMEDKELVRDKTLLKYIEKDLNNVQKNLSTYEKIRKFTLLDKPFTIETGELTPTMKIKRNVVEQKFADIIEKMYHKV